MLLLSSTLKFTSEMIEFTSQNLLIPFKTENRRTTNPQIFSTFFCQTKQQKEKTKQSNTIELNGIDQGRKKINIQQLFTENFSHICCELARDGEKNAVAQVSQSKPTKIHGIPFGVF